MKEVATVPIDRLICEPYISVLCFPNPNETEARNRVEELRIHGVSALEFFGKASVHGVPLKVLGKGFVGIVVVALLNGVRVAVKIRRADADRVDLLHEAQMLQKAAAVEVAPKLVSASNNFLVMQLIEGELLPDWLRKQNDKALVKNALSDVLESCRKLDEIRLDHGELSKAPKHVILDEALKPWIVDFETASDKRRPANLPAICNFLFTGQGEVTRTIASILGERDKQAIIKAIGEYKKVRMQENFDRVLQKCLAD